MRVVVKGNVLGKVQGVWFRRHVQMAAENHGVSGYAKNLPDGSVEVVLAGEEGDVRQVRQAVEKGPMRSRVDKVRWSTVDEILEAPGFLIL